jgi:hypothetical protein
MGDRELRRAEILFESESSNQNLAGYLRQLERHGALSDSTLRNLLVAGPFGPEIWPWRDHSYHANMHSNILDMLLLIRPRDVLIDVIGTWSNPKNLIAALYVVWGRLVERQMHDILDPEIHLEIHDYEFNLEVAKDMGLKTTPAAIWLDWEHPWEASDWGYPIDSDPVVTVIWDGDYNHPETVRSAWRGRVGTDMEPYSDFYWEQHWQSQGKNSRWWAARSIGVGRKESKTLVPYRKYCSMHKQDLIHCDPCPACGTESHECYCEKCDSCGLYIPNWEESAGDLKVDMRCHCECADRGYRDRDLDKWVDVCIYPTDQCLD